MVEHFYFVNMQHKCSDLNKLRNDAYHKLFACTGWQKCTIMQCLCELQEMACHPLCRRRELKDMLPIEMQRLTKYPLLIDSVVKHTSGKYCCTVYSLLTRWVVWLIIYEYTLNICDIVFSHENAVVLSNCYVLLLEK